VMPLWRLGISSYTRQRQTKKGAKMMQPVRNLMSARVHIADVTETRGATHFGADYQAPPRDTEALCGVDLFDGVVMQPDTNVNCPTCRYALKQGKGQG
jgi:hypothetical protein